MSEATLLPELLRRESRSYLQYVREAFPWARGREVPVRDAILRMGSAEADRIARLGTLLQKRHVPMPGLGAFPTSFTDSNFIAARALVPKLLAAERRSLADLERDLAAVVDDEPVRTTLEDFASLKRTHVAELESLNGAVAA